MGLVPSRAGREAGVRRDWVVMYHANVVNPDYKATIELQAEEGMRCRVIRCRRGIMDLDVNEGRRCE
jgi:hypothetical protein